VIAQTEDMEEQIARLEDPKNFSLTRRARRLRAAAYLVRERNGNPTKRLIRVTTRYVMTISEVAALMQLSIIELLHINTDLVGLTEVEPGTEVRGYGSATGS
jgi:hypothetical protein